MKTLILFLLISGAALGQNDSGFLYISPAARSISLTDSNYHSWLAITQATRTIRTIDTIKVVMLCVDTTRFKNSGWYFGGIKGFPSFGIIGYLVSRWNYPNDYLDENKKELPKSVIVVISLNAK